MTHALTQLTDADLRELAAALRAGRLAPPFTPLGLSRWLHANGVESVTQELNRLSEPGTAGTTLAMAIELLVQDRAGRASQSPPIELVTSGPEAPGVLNRDTSVVVRELFAHAEKTVLVAGYAVYQGRQVFQALAQRMTDRPDLRVRLFLDVKRKPGDTTRASDLVRRFATNFRAKDWPTDAHLPEVYYDPRSLDLGQSKRASLHAKCVVVDSHHVFVSSANFTEAAQERNIEVGLLVRSPSLAEQLERHFDALLAAKMLEVIP